MYINTPQILQNCDTFRLDMLRNSETLNIFSDASMRNITNKKNRDCHEFATCFGAIAVSYNVAMDELFQINYKSTVPAAELRGIRCSLYLALKYRNNFRVINIFSDSLYSVNALRDNIMNWVWDEKTAAFYNSKVKRTNIVKNQNLLFECHRLIYELRKTNIVNIMHQRGHIQSHGDLNPAIECFKLNNGVFKVDPDVIRYISNYNNYVDEKSRMILYSKNPEELKYFDAINFVPNPKIFMR